MPPVPYALLPATAVAYHNQPLVERVNARKPSWVARGNKFIAGYGSLDALRSLMGALDVDAASPLDAASPPRRQLDDGGDALPARFDAREQWPHCVSIGAIGDQGQCGACWAFGPTAAFNDRLCIHDAAQRNVTLSVQATLACAGQPSNGCAGGRQTAAWDLFADAGLPTAACQPYTPPPCPAEAGSAPDDANNASSQPTFAPTDVSTTEGANPCWGPLGPANGTQSTPQCLASGCAYYGDWDGPHTLPPGSDVGELRYFSAGPHYAVGPEQNAVMRELMRAGPVSASMQVYEDFLHYGGGVYTRVDGERIGGHVVRVLGWGVDDASGGGPYWLVANEWTAAWGEEGFFRIARLGADGAGFGNFVAGPMDAPTATPTVSAAPTPGADTGGPDEVPRPSAHSHAATRGGGHIGIFAALALIGVVLIGYAAYFVVERRRKRVLTVPAEYAGVVELADRAGRSDTVE